MTSNGHFDQLDVSHRSHEFDTDSGQPQIPLKKSKIQTELQHESLSSVTSSAAHTPSTKSTARSELRHAGTSSVTTHQFQKVNIHIAAFKPTTDFDRPKKVDGKQPPPSPSQILQQRELVAQTFWRIGEGRTLVLDKKVDRDENGKKMKQNLICYSNIQQISSLAPSDLDDLKFIVVFLRANQGFTSHFENGHKYDGWMWGIGWRVATESGVIIGRYLKISTIAKDLPGYKQVSDDAARAADILGRWFLSVGDVAFQTNQDQMHSAGTPGFSILEMPEDQPTTNTSFGNHLTYTNHHFANFPHADATDASHNAFMFSYASVIKTGLLAPSDYDNSEEFFPFPDYGFYLDFSGHTFVKVIWGAKYYRHFTMPCKRGPSGLYDRTSGSVQVNQKALNTTQSYYNGGFVNNPKRNVVSGYSFIVDKAKQRNDR